MFLFPQQLTKYITIPFGEPQNIHLIVANVKHVNFQENKYSICVSYRDKLKCSTSSQVTNVKTSYFYVKQVKYVT